MKLLRLKLFILTGLLATSIAVAGQNPAPVLFFTDLISGPAKRNSDNTYTSAGGAYVTLYGNYLDNFSSITLNGSACLTVVSKPATWMWYERMVVKIGTTCTTGNWSITTPGGTFTGPMPETKQERRSSDFTVVSGHIYYVSTSGNDSTGTGSFSNPWATLPHAKRMMVNGDITYAENGYSDDIPDPDHGWGIITLTNVTCASPGSQIAMVAYPGATVTIGDANSNTPGVRPYDGGCTGYTFAEIKWLGNGVLNYGSGGLYAVDNIHSIGNDISCPNLNGATGCEADGSIDLAHQGIGLVQLGNNFHDIGTRNNSLAHAIYHGNTISVIDAWNQIINVTGACRGIQVFSSTSGFVHHDIHIHDNIIHDTGCDGIGLYDTDSTGSGYIYGGGAEVYNNVIFRAGINGAGGSADSAGIYYSIDNSPSSSSVVEIYNNTIFDVQAGNPDAAMHCAVFGSTGPKEHVHNNVIYQLVSPPVYFDVRSCGAGNVYGSNNLVYGIGGIGSQCPSCTGTVNSNPSFVNTSENGCPDRCVTNLQLSVSSSPANGAGSTSGPVPTYDINGLMRPSPPSIGAYEFATRVGAVRPPHQPYSRGASRMTDKSRRESGHFDGPSTKPSFPSQAKAQLSG